jgi:hypothetical protein
MGLRFAATIFKAGKSDLCEIVGLMVAALSFILQLRYVNTTTCHMLMVRTFGFGPDLLGMMALVSFCCHGSHKELVVRLVDTLLHIRCSFLSLSAPFSLVCVLLRVKLFPFCNNDNYMHPFGCRG